MQMTIVFGHCFAVQNTNCFTETVCTWEQDLLDFVEDLDEEAVYRCPIYRLLEDALFNGNPGGEQRESGSEAEQADGINNEVPKPEVAGECAKNLLPPSQKVSIITALVP